MGIKEVRVGATAAVFAVLVDFRAYVGEQLAVYLISFVGTMQTSPEVDSPACTPTGGIIALDFQGLGCGSSKFRSCLPKSDGMDRAPAGVTGGDDANPGLPNRGTTPSDCLASRCGKGAGD